MIYIMTSAMMPNDGTYRKTTMIPEAWAAKFNALTSAGQQHTSYVGYDNAARIIAGLLGIDIPVSRAETTFADGDIAFCAQLTYRVLSPEEKAQGIHGKSICDYKFSVVEYAGDGK